MTCGASHGFIVVLIFILYELAPFSKIKYPIFSTIKKIRYNYEGYNVEFTY